MAKIHIKQEKMKGQAGLCNGRRMLMSCFAGAGADDSVELQNDRQSCCRACAGALVFRSILNPLMPSTFFMLCPLNVHNGAQEITKCPRS